MVLKLNETAPNRVELVDKITSRVCVAIYGLCCIPFSLLITLITLFQADPSTKYYILIPFAAVVMISFIVYHYEKKLGTKFCKFVISDETIEILIPPKPWFKISWSEIEGIAVKKIRKRILAERYADEIFPVLIFKCRGDSEIRPFKLRKFHSNKKREIINLLESYALRLRKDFYGLSTMKDI
jgi:hypothetical protein